MKQMKKAGPIIRGLAVAVAALACVSVAKAHPYASCLTNIDGTNISFYLNEGGGAVTVVTYPSGATNSLGTLANAGGYTFALPSGDTSYTISVSKTGSGTPSQTSTDANLNIVNSSGMQIRGVGVGNCAQFGDAFGRVTMATTGQSAVNTHTPQFRGDGLYALTPDLAYNALYGGLSPKMAVTTWQSNVLTCIAAPANGNTFILDNTTWTWTTNTPTNSLQIAISTNLATDAANLAAAVNADSTNHPATQFPVTVNSNAVTLVQFAQNTGGSVFSTKFTFGTSGASGPFGPAWFGGNSGNNIQVGPIRVAVNPTDGTIWVADSTPQGANIYEFGRNYEFTNEVFSVTGDSQTGNEHGGIEGVDVRGSLAQGNLQIWTYDFDLSVPQYFNDTVHYTMGNGGVGNFGGPQVTQTGDQNEIYRYDIGSGNAGAFPVTNSPVWACTLGLNGANFGGQRGVVCIGPNTNYVYAGFFRANLSDGNLQVFRSDTGARVLTSLGGTAQSPNDWAANDPNGNKGVLSLRVSPDGRFLAWTFSDSYIGIVNLTNGVPDASSLIYINNGAGSTSSRDLAWDAADNIYAVGLGAIILREYSLGLTSTCVTSNDVTGTNGSFQFSLPSADATATVANNASQNYGSPIAGNVNINIGTSSLSSPLSVPFTISGTAVNGVNYTMQTGAIGNGVTVTSNSATSGTITFPATNYPGIGNWNANIAFTPTASPVVGPTLTVKVAINPGATYILGSPGSAILAISNTGPQYFFISASPVPGANNMNRGITNDYAQFVITRWGDLNGPSNSVGNINPTTITLTNFVLAGTATFPTDYTAGVQPFVQGSTPADGSANVPFPPGVASQVVMVGNPVSHINVLVPPTNLTILPTLTNSVTGTNVTSAEGYSYTVTTATTTLNEIDNAQGTRAEVVVWSDPLTNSVNPQAVVTYSGGSMATNTVLPVYIPNYQYTNGGAPNGSGANLQNPSNLFDVQLGWSLGDENSWESSSGTFGGAYSPPPSAVMVNNGWSNVLRITVDKNNAYYPSSVLPTDCGVNYFPTTNQFYGNYAMRFDMYLSVWSGALDNNDALQYPKQFAAFGINTQGTNCDWRTNPGGGNAGQNNVTNSDGIWFAIDAGDLSLTPADFDSFASPAIPNMGTSDIQSQAAVNESEIFKSPPFALLDGSGGGTPHNQWVNVSVETRAQTTGLEAVSLSVDSEPIFSGITLTNTAFTPPNNVIGVPSGNWSNGVPMLGYLQPYSYQSDESAFVYYSNLRIVELSPTITTVPSSQLVLKGSTVTLGSTGSYSQSGLTNIWYRGTTAPATVVSNDTTLTATPFTYSGIGYYGASDTLTLANIQNGSNYWSVWSDNAGAVTSYVASVEVVTPPANAQVNSGANATFTVSGNGPAALATFQWQTNGVNLANNTKYANVTTATLTVSNVNANDTALTYNCVVQNKVTNLVGLYIVTNFNTLVTPGASLALNVAPTSAIVSPAAQTNLWGSTASFTVAASGGSPATYTYQWKFNGNNIASATKSSLSVSNLTTANGGNYTCGVSNTAGGLLSTVGALTVSVPAPTFTGISASGTSVTMKFSSTNPNDTTNAFKLLSAPVANAYPFGSTNSPAWTNTAATFSTSGGGNFQVVAPQTGTTKFYLLEHNP